MNNNKAAEMLSSDLSKLMDRYAREFDMPLQTAIGCLEWEKAKLLNETLNPELYEENEE